MEDNSASTPTAGALAFGFIAVVAIAILGAALTVGVTWVLLVPIGKFDLTFWNTVGIGLLWYIADQALQARP